MRKLYMFAAVLIFASASSQIVNIPDTAFKNRLLNYDPPIDTNNDDEIQVSEALAVTALTLGTGSWPQIHITDFTGLEAFTNLTYFNHNTSQSGAPITVDFSPLTNLEHIELNGGLLVEVNISGLSNLQYLKCSGEFPFLDLSNKLNLVHFECYGPNLNNLDFTDTPNLEYLATGHYALTNLLLPALPNLTYLKIINAPIATINVNQFPNLTTLILENCDLTTLDVSGLANLEILTCNRNQLSTVDISNLINLVEFDCSYNLMTSIDISNQPALTKLSCWNNQLTSLDMSNNSFLREVYCLYNQFTTLDFSPLTDADTTLWNYYNFSENPLLEYVNLKNGHPNNFLPQPTIQDEYYLNCPQLSYVCADEEYLADVMEALQISNSDAQVNSYCSFTPGGDYNSIVGTISVDFNNNGCEESDPFMPGIRVNITDGSTSGATFSGTSGDYAFFTDAGTFIVTPDLEVPNFIITPENYTANFPVTDGTVETVNFCISPDGIVNDVEVVILPIVPAQPGFDAVYKIIYKNKGNQILSGTIDFTFDDPVLDFVSSSPIVASQAASILSWNYNNLYPFETRIIDLVLNVNAPTEIPPVNINTIISFSATIYPLAGDVNAADNLFTLEETVIGSYDPNDKTCLQGSVIGPDMIGEYLHYLIRFQNSGTAAATNVVIKDMIDLTKFDIGSFQMIGASHPNVTRITGNKVEFIFEQIHLPAEQDDEPGSHGFVVFKIKSRNNLNIGSTLTNKADIYFDYNFPIETNTVSTTISTLALDEYESSGIKINPNPVSDLLTITSNDLITLIELFDLQGRLIKVPVEMSGNITFGMARYPAGIYLIKIYTQNGIRIKKVIKV